MKLSFLLLFSLCLNTFMYAQAEVDEEKITRACLNYIEGFYEGDSTKLVSSVMPRLHKMGFWKNRGTGEYAFDSYMTFQQAKDYANNVKRDKKFASEKAPKVVEVLDIMNHIAAAKITAWWGTDYLLLAKVGDKWMIEQALWEGPLDRKSVK